MSTEFYQSGPELENTFTSEPLLKKWLKVKLSIENFSRISPQLESCGEKAVSSWNRLSKKAESSEPIHRPFDPWGKRIDEIDLCPGWKELENEAALEGIVATAYARKLQQHSRLHQMSLLYLFHPSSAFVSCPLAMTDGAARCLELLGSTAQQKKAFQKLTSFDPQNFWTSGQWMTEKTGGSDVSQTATVALQNGDEFKLYGTKWFTSATTAQMSLALAKIQGSDTLTLFYVELRDEESRLKNIEILRLKSKLGTKALPTAEILLKGTPAQKIGEVGQGVKNIATMLNITRTYNAICSVSHMRRGIDLLKSYSHQRYAFRKKLNEHVLHQQWMQNMELTWKKSFAFVFRISELLGAEETFCLGEQEKMELRLMTPILKLYTARECMRITSWVCEGFGGAGYIEDVGIAKLLRDAQVFSIWEGTTHVLALDFLRVVKKEESALMWLKSLLEKARDKKNHQHDELGYDFLKMKNLLSRPVSEWENKLGEAVFSMAKVYAHLSLIQEGLDPDSVEV
jgi:putative acyl-CoA dehydrogenase